MNVSGFSFILNKVFCNNYHLIFLKLYRNNRNVSEKFVIFKILQLICSDFYVNNFLLI